MISEEIHEQNSVSGIGINLDWVWGDSSLRTRLVKIHVRHLQNGQKMLEQKLHLCIGVKAQIQININCQSIPRSLIQLLFAFKLFHETVNYCNYRTQLSNYAKRQRSKNKEAVIRW